MRRKNSLTNTAYSTQITRRDLLHRAAVMGLSVPAIAGLLAACGGGSSKNTPTTATGSGGAATSAATAGGSTSTSAAAASPAGASGGAGAEGTPGGTLTFGAWQTPDTMDPQKTGLARYKPNSRSSANAVGLEIPWR